MPLDLVLPDTTGSLVKRVSLPRRHPGLQLDKYSPPGDQSAQKQALERVCETTGDRRLLADLLERRNACLSEVGALEWQCETAGPLTLHLARASALENAGICLHPLYGFAYLPGSGLKGMARAYAETVWLRMHADPVTAWRSKIEPVFGWAPGSDDWKEWKPDRLPRHSEEDDAHAGAIVFHDAWPLEWPKLIVDITNNHHSKYYQGDDAPGDWDDPIPIYFLAVPAGIRFTFAVSRRHSTERDELVQLARTWLVGALCHMGAGAKTAAGYGTFHPTDAALQPPALSARETFEATLELVTPAFLAGASQQEGDCDLRPATLRGLLRWWWRTLHAGFVSVDTLRALEASVWGDTSAGSPVRIEVEQSHPIARWLYDKNEIKDASGLEASGAQKTTQGLFYSSYGMDEGRGPKRKQRWCGLPGAGWAVRFGARDGHYPADAEHTKSKLVRAEMVLEQAEAALWLLSRYGGLGSKGRKGFGSFVDVPVPGINNIDDCLESAHRFRRACGIVEETSVEPASSALNQGIRCEVRTPWNDPWFALDQAGYSLQAFAKSCQPSSKRIALGLPRNLGGTERKCAKGGRHAAPVHFHLAKEPDETLTVRATAFPARWLPDAATSGSILRHLIEHLERDLADRAKRLAGKGTKVRRAPAQSAVHRPAAPAPVLPKPGDRVPAVLTDDKTKKGGWKARHEPTGMSGPIQNSGDVPGDKQPGDTVELIIAVCSQREINFRWPTAADAARATKGNGGGVPRHGKAGARPPRSRR